MAKLISPISFVFVSLILLLFFSSPSNYAAANNVIVNPQPTYAVPPGASNVLILDLTLPEILKTIKISNLGTAQQWDIASLSIWEDGASPGWDGDELEKTSNSSSPFWDNEYAYDFKKQRIFVTVSIASTVSFDKTIKPRAVINSTQTVTGLERTIQPGASQPSVPVAPLARFGQALSTSTIRWFFLDLSNNEFGFRIRDNSLKAVAQAEKSDLSYLDETGLRASTCYSSRRAHAFNDRGENSASSNFDEVCTLAEKVQPAQETEIQPVASTTAAEPAKEEPPEIAVRKKIIEILLQLIQLLQQRIAALQASLFNAFDIFANWFAR